MRFTHWWPFYLRFGSINVAVKRTGLHRLLLSFSCYQIWCRIGLAWPALLCVQFHFVKFAVVIALVICISHKFKVRSNWLEQIGKCKTRLLLLFFTFFKSWKICSFCTETASPRTVNHNLKCGAKTMRYFVTLSNVVIHNCHNEDWLHKIHSTVQTISSWQTSMQRKA